jgi:transposase-like protein
MPRATACFTNAQKLAILREQTNRGLTNTAISEQCGVTEGTIRRWRKSQEQLESAKGANSTVHIGRPRENQELEALVLDRLSNLLFFGVPLNHQDVIQIALSIDQDFKSRSKSKLANWASSFLKKENIVLRTTTQYGIRTSEQIESIVTSFNSSFISIINQGNYPEALVLNLDQTGVFFSNARKRILAIRGSSQVAVIANKLSVRATALMTIAMDGTKLPPYVVFKGSNGPRRRIQQSFAALPSTSHYSVQPNAWIDMAEMIHYVDVVLVPFLAQYPGRRCLLLLDSFSVHLSAMIQTKLVNSGYDLLFIPKGMTGILQPLDIAVNKPFKDRLKTQYTNWLIEKARHNNIITKRPKPAREDIALWIESSWSGISRETIQHSFNRQRQAIAADTISNLFNNIIDS